MGLARAAPSVGQEEGEAALLRAHRRVLRFSVLLPFLVFLGAAWHDRAGILREGEETVLRTAAVMHEHAAKVLETVDLLLARVDERVAPLGWDEIAAPETSAFLARLKAPLEQAVSVWVTDAAGRVRAGSHPWNPSVSIAERDFFEAQREADAGTYVSAAFRGRATGQPGFAMSRRRTTPDGRFDGIVHVALSPAYFARVFAEAAPPLRHAAALVRADGEVLARDPPHPQAPARLPPESPLRRALEERPGGGLAPGVSTLDGVRRVYAYRRVGTYPVYVGFGVERAELLGRWRSNLVAFGAVALAAAAALLTVTALALRAARAERAGAERLRAALAELRLEAAARREAEDRMRQASKMEALGQLAGGIAHDMNNVLQAVSGAARLIARAPGEAERVARLAAMAQEAAERGAAVTGRLLAFARRDDLRAEAVPVAPFLADLAEMLRHSLGGAVELRVEAPEGLPPLLADRGQLAAVLVNLATNARDAMPRGGRILLSAGGPEQLEGAAGRFLRLAVADEGSGMDEATLARAAEPFFTTKPLGEGTGLGLPMARAFAEQSGGRLAIASAPGRGTVVTLWLPHAAAGGRAPADAPDAGPRAPAGARALLVDDNAPARSVVASELAAQGWDVGEAEGPADALDRLRTGERFDLLVTDLAMPGMDGLALLREARRLRPGLPALLVTGFVGRGERTEAGLREAASGGPFELLRKPTDPRRLAASAARLAEAAQPVR